MHETTPPPLKDTENYSHSTVTDTQTTPAQKGVKHRLSEEQRLEIARLYAEAGASVADIRRQFGVSEPSVYRVLEKQGVSLRGRANARTVEDTGENRVQPIARRSRTGNASVPTKRRVSRTQSDRLESTSGSVQFRIGFRLEQVINAADIRDALRQAEARGATDITEIIRVA